MSGRRLPKAFLVGLKLYPSCIYNYTNNNIITNVSLCDTSIGLNQIAQPPIKRFIVLKMQVINADQNKIIRREIFLYTETTLTNGQLLLIDSIILRLLMIVQWPSTISDSVCTCNINQPLNDAENLHYKRKEFPNGYVLWEKTTASYMSRHKWWTKRQTSASCRPPMLPNHRERCEMGIELKHKSAVSVLYITVNSDTLTQLRHRIRKRINMKVFCFT